LPITYINFLHIPKIAGALKEKSKDILTTFWKGVRVVIYLRKGNRSKRDVSSFSSFHVFASNAFTSYKHDFNTWPLR
jgi:sRNA-binding regulator protein Hfq